MGSPHEPRLARVAAMVADPTRSRMLAYLLGGEFASAGELARAASVTPATASAHLAKLVDARFLVCEARGRHRYFRLADAQVAHALEALASVAERPAPDRRSHDAEWAPPERARLRQARCCYGHLAGGLGVRLFDALHASASLRATPDGYALTPAGERWLEAIGLRASAPSSRRRYAYPCLDWSERRDHLAGQLADELLRHFIDRGWLRRGEGRALDVTVAGTRALLPALAQGASASITSRKTSDTLP